MTYRYFTISVGLRGRYMQDDSAEFRFRTRRELRAAVCDDCKHAREGYGFGGSKAEIAHVVARLWREAGRKTGRTVYPMAIGFGRTRSRADRPFGVFVAHSTRADWIAANKEA